MWLLNLDRYSIFIGLYLVLSVYCYPQNPSDTLYFGLSKKSLIDINSSDAQIAIELMVNHISEMKFKNKIITKVFDNSEEIIEAYKNRQIDLLAVLAQDYLKLKNKIELEAKFLSKRGGDIFLEYYLIANKNTGLVDTPDKYHKLLVYNSQGNDLPYEWLNKAFAKLNLGPYDEYFTTIEEVRKPGPALLPVFFDKADACIVANYDYKTMAELNPQIDNKLKVILKSEKYPTAVLCLRSDLQPVYKKSFTEAISELPLTEKGKQILSLFKIAGHVEFREEYLNNLYELFDYSKESNN